MGASVSEITVNLLANGKLKESIKLNKGNNWKHTFKDLPKYDETTGVEIIYSISENALEGYETLITGSMKKGFTIVNKEDSKSGIYEENLEEFIKACESCKFVKIKGLMTIAPYVENLEEVRWIFSKMKEIFEKLKLNNYENIEMKYLSMGMSNDYKVAIEEGLNMIRIGTAVFENRN